MPQYEFECLFCQKITAIFLGQGDRLNRRVVRCEWCGEKHVRIRLFFRDSTQQVAMLREQIEKMAERIENLENGEDPVQDVPISN